MTSTFGSSVGSKRRIIIKNPDGTFMHCYKDGERDSAYLPFKPVKNQDINHNNIDALTISDADLEYVVDNYEQFDQGNILEEFVSILQRNQIIFLILLIMEFSLSTFLFFVTWQHREHSIKLIQHLYKEIGLNTTKIVFYILFALTCGINIAFYPLGFYSLYTKKFKLLGYFANFALVTGVLTIFVVYINMLFLLVFILRLVIYTLARFICNLIISIIVLPRRIQNNQYNSIEEH